MVALTALWLPMVASPIAVFLVSSGIHMATKWHQSEYPKVPDEDRLRAALGPMAIAPGDYMVPRCVDMKDMRSPEFVARMQEGPVVMMTVMPNQVPNMGRYLGQWFVYCVVTTLFAAHVAAISLAPGADHAVVFHTVWETAFAGYALALWQMLIWYRRSLATTVRATVDGLVYALVTGALFAWAWPQ